MSPLQKAIENEDLPSVRRLLTESPNLIDECIGPKHIPLALHAARASSFEILRYIVEYSRASLDIYDDDRRNILHYGAMSGDPERCRYLVERCGMDPLSGDRDLVTPYEISWDLARGGTGEELYAWFLDKKSAVLMRKCTKTPSAPASSRIRPFWHTGMIFTWSILPSYIFRVSPSPTPRISYTGK